MRTVMLYVAWAFIKAAKVSFWVGEYLAEHADRGRTHNGTYYVAVVYSDGEREFLEVNVN